jgi:hypothetical protein
LAPRPLMMAVAIFPPPIKAILQDWSGGIVDVKLQLCLGLGQYFCEGWLHFGNLVEVRRRWFFAPTLLKNSPRIGLSAV